ncbi:hypothetical protein [Vitiosangium sp. GDMCC 1.1324]|uniref:hypothetical protein n=1 Tax=Vitiosangium sp. (strain GDMCC 1.1324) TaxID=2138576 RepID=UPI000D35F651|nr:hypothetical protein [Vitiosangium sp. GDMCC 1.1324]PTL80518.1 hypothetical protein DAT35_28195 [Vitiosangium sp. GDMCC 1.1324]
MKIDSTLNMPRMSTNVTTARVTPDTSFAARVQSGVGTAANAVAGGVGVVANLVPGGSVVSAAVSSLTTFGNSTGSGSAPYVGAALSSGGAPMNTTLNSGGGVSTLGGTTGSNGQIGNVGSGTVGGEFNGEMQSMFAEQKKLLGVQMSLQRENQVFSTISNVMKTRHDTAKNAIGNIR